MALGKPCAVEGPEGPVGIEVEPFPVPGKVALYLEDAAKAGEGFGTQEGDTLGLKVTESGTDRHFYYVPNCAKLDGATSARLKGAPLLFSGRGTTTDPPRQGARGGTLVPVDRRGEHAENLPVRGAR